MHTPYQSLAQACEAPGITSEVCPEQPGFICKCTGMAWNNPRARLLGQGPCGVGVRTKWKFPQIYFPADFIPVEHTLNPSSNWQIRGAPFRPWKRAWDKVRVGLCQRQRAGLFLWLTSAWAGRPSNGGHSWCHLSTPDWIQRPAFAQRTLHIKANR